ncbi:MAG: methionine synthase [Candidatus Sericytochromatia bacterium]|nr:methionine synthase [Candidatus Sericytochromatia bacterium]
MHPYLAALEQRVLVFDGGMGTMLQPLELTPDDYQGLAGCPEILVASRPDVIRQVHRAYLEAGADVVETNTFGGNRLKLAEWGLGERVHEINVAAARLAREMADAFAAPDRPRFVAGSIGPTGMLPSSGDPVLGAIGFEALADIFREQALALMDGGCDLLLVETAQDILEVRAAIAGIRRAFAAAGRTLPLQVQVTLDTTGRMLLGTDIGAALAIIGALPVDVVGLNCATGPDAMREPVALLAERSTRPVSILPNAGLPLNVDGKAVYPLEPEPMAHILAEYVSRYGVRVVGGCCGTTPAHIRALVAAVAHLPPQPRPGSSPAHVASAMRAVALDQEPAPLLVGERLNAQGSRKVKQLLLDGDDDGLVQVARQQVAAGAHVLDVCVALTERADEAQTMARVVGALSRGVEAPLMIDSTEPAVLREALRACPGRAIVNSVHLENGRTRIDTVLPDVLEHGAAVVALTIDEEGMARSADRKLAVAARIHDLCVAGHGLASDALIVDTLTFTLATGDPEYARSALETIDGIRRVKEALPGVRTILGVSNVSFGLGAEARKVVNAVFLHHAVRAGLDMAIVHPDHVLPLHEMPDEARELAEDLVLARREDALPRLIAWFDRAEGVPVAGNARASGSDAGTAEERIHRQIVERRREGIETLLDEVLARRSAVSVLNEVLLPAMKEVGDRFGAGELILPFVLQSAEVMKRAVAHVEPHLDRVDGVTKGTVVLATVFGDVHDIGKNLVHVILANNGYTVHDLGKQVPVQTILDRARELGADAIGLSALLVSTSKQMPICVEEAHRQGLHLPILIGGAAINPSFGRRVALLPDGQPYPAGVYYARDAFEGLSLLDRLTDPERREALVGEVREAALAAAERPERPSAPVVRVGRSAVPVQDVLPEPPFWGARALDDVPLDDLFDLLDRDSLFRLSWGGRGTKGEAWDRLVEDTFVPRLRRFRAELRSASWVRPRAVFGFYACVAEGDAIVVYPDPEAREPVGRFHCPRQSSGEHLSLADYVRPVDAGGRDVLALQAVTVGAEVTEHLARLQAGEAWADAYMAHGLAVELAEALAEWTHRRVRSLWGLAEGRGKRYSWGYPAIPDLDDHRTLFRVLPVAEAIGLSLTEACQLLPEQSTVAVVLHHPEARYFSVRPAAGGPA